MFGLHDVYWSTFMYIYIWEYIYIYVHLYVCSNTYMIVSAPIFICACLRVCVVCQPTCILFSMSCVMNSKILVGGFSRKLRASNWMPNWLKIYTWRRSDRTWILGFVEVMPLYRKKILCVCLSVSVCGPSSPCRFLSICLSRYLFVQPCVWRMDDLS